MRQPLLRRSGTPSSPASLDGRGYAIATWVVLAVLSAAVVVLAIRGRWLGVAVLGGTIVLSLLFIRFEDRLPRVFNLLFVLAGALNAGAYVFNLWNGIAAYDEFVHAFTTFAIAAAFGKLWFGRAGASDGVRAAPVLAFGIAVGLAGEGFEWLIGIIGGPLDTVVDIVMDSLGAAAAALFCKWTNSLGARRENA